MGNFCRKHCKAIRCLLPCVFKNDTGETVTVISNPHADGPFVSVPPNDTGGDGNKALMYVALYDYQARTPDELSFYAGDRMQILNSNQQNWLKAKLLSPRGNPEGYVPFNYVAPITSIESEPYFFCDFKRSDAEKQLILPGNGVGSFLIRESESQKGSYALSVYDGTSVKHYKIQTSDNGRYFISTNRVFSSLPELVTFYRRSEGGLCCRLTNPCQRTGVPLPPDLCYQTSDHWEIDRTSLKFLKKLGHGQFGEVWEGLWTNTISVAIKTLKEGTMNPQDFLREAQFMKNLKHSKLIQLYAVCTLEEPVYIITELMRHGSLLSYLQNDRGATIGLPQQVDIAAQVSSGMEYLERQNFIHRDLAARNVLVGENGVYKVADFGLARVFEDDAVYLARKDTKLPLKWTAPEAIRDNKFSVKSDVWSFGILLYEISTYGQMPYQGMTGREAHEKVMRGYRLPKPPGCHASFYKIMLECWIEQPENRPTFATLQWRLEDFFEEESSSYYDPRPFLQ